MAKNTIYFVGSLSSCASIPTLPIPFAIHPSLYIPNFNLEGFLSLLCTHYNGVITVLLCHNEVITFFRTTVPITKNLYSEIRKHERLDLFFCLKCAPLLSTNKKRKKERQKKKSLCIATLPLSPQEQPHELGRSLPAWFVPARMALNSSVDVLSFTLAGDLALYNGNGQSSP